MLECVTKEGELDLRVGGLYEELADPSARAEGMVRVVDESGEDYLYPEGYFAPPPPPADATGS